MGKLTWFGPLFCHVFGAVAALSVVEFALLQKFNRWYFAFGPALLKFTTRADPSWRAEQFISAVNGIGPLIARQVNDHTVLVRRSVRSQSRWAFARESAWWWSPRIKIALSRDQDGHALSLELRYTLCWPLFAIATGVAMVAISIYAVVASFPDLILLCLPIAGAIALCLYIAAVSAGKDARRVWDLARQYLASPQ